MKQKFVSWYCRRIATAPLFPDIPRIPVYERQLCIGTYWDSRREPTFRVVPSTFRMTEVSSDLTKTIKAVPTS